MNIGRNDPCPCGSEKKYKKCCETKDEAKEHAALENQWTEASKQKEREDKEAEKQRGSKPSPMLRGSPAAKAGHPAAQGGPQKRQTFAAPKYNMPRKSGGGS